VSLAEEMKVPAIDDPMPKVAEVPTWNQTFPAEALLVRTIEELVAVVSVLPI